MRNRSERVQLLETVKASFGIPSGRNEGSFRKWGASSYWCDLGEGFEIGVQVGGWLWVCLWKMTEKGKGVGRVGGGDRQRNRQVSAHAFVKTYP